MTVFNHLPARAPIELSDCVFLCCFPLSKSGFEAALQRSEFCRGFYVWTAYERILQADRRLGQLKKLSQLGLRGKAGASFQDLVAAARDRPPLIAIIGHCRNKSEIEFDDGFFSFSEITAALQSDWEGVLDVSVCRPTVDLVKLARERANKCLIRTAGEELNAKNYLLFYVDLFLKIYEFGTYGSALIKTIADFAPKENESPLW